MNNLSQKQIEKIKTIKSWTPTAFHGNTKMVDCLPVSLIRDIVAKKQSREMAKSHNDRPLLNVELIKRLTLRSLDNCGTNYSKIFIQGNANIYFAHPAYGHFDYNKKVVCAMNDNTLKAITIANKLISKHAL